MKNTTKVLYVLASAILAASLVACGGSSSSEDAPAEKQETQQVQADVPEEDEGEQEEQEEQEAAADAAVAVTIDGAKLSQDYEGKPAVIITYTFTNVSSDEAESFMVSCTADVYQNGVQCERAFVTNLEGDEMAKVKAGASNTFQIAYEVTDRSPLEVEVKELFSWDDTLLASASINLE